MRVFIFSVYFIIFILVDIIYFYIYYIIDSDFLIYDVFFIYDFSIGWRVLNNES